MPQFLSKPWTPKAPAASPTVPAFVESLLPAKIVEPQIVEQGPEPFSPEALEDLRMRVANKLPFTEEELKRAISTLRANRRSAMSSEKKPAKAAAKPKGSSRGMTTDELGALLGI